MKHGFVYMMYQFQIITYIDLNMDVQTKESIREFNLFSQKKILIKLNNIFKFLQEMFLAIAFKDVFVVHKTYKQI